MYKSTELKFEKPPVQFQWNVKLISFLLRHFKRSQQFIPYINVPAIKELKVTREPSKGGNMMKVSAWRTCKSSSSSESLRSNYMNHTWKSWSCPSFFADTFSLFLSCKVFSLDFQQWVTECTAFHTLSLTACFQKSHGPETMATLSTDIRQYQSSSIAWAALLTYLWLIHLILPE